MPNNFCGSKTNLLTLFCLNNDLDDPYDLWGKLLFKFFLHVFLCDARDGQSIDFCKAPNTNNSNVISYSCSMPFQVFNNTCLHIPKMITSSDQKKDVYLFENS